MPSTKQFDEIYKNNYPKVIRLCLGYFEGNEALAKDITQDVFVKVWENLKHFRHESSVSTWIYRITVNTCLSNIKKQKKHPVSLDKNHFHLKSEALEKDIDKESQLNALYRCINTLNNDNKSLILLELEDLAQKEIAAITGLSHSAVRTRIHRIKDKLTKCVSS